MLEFIDTVPDVDVQASEYRRLLGYPHGHELEERARELADWARSWYAAHGRPWIYARQAGGFTLADGRLYVGGLEFSPARLQDRLAAAGADDVIAVAVSAGSECEAMARTLWEEGKPDEYFFLEIYGSAVVEHLVTAAAFRLCAWADRHDASILPHDSPGYPGWNIAEQRSLRALIEERRTLGLPGEITVLDTGMLSPKKSLLALFGVTALNDRIRRLTDLSPCENCPMPSCGYRRVPYKRSLPRPEERRQPDQAAAAENPAPYSFAPRALRKWTAERLQMSVLDNGSVRARFRYSGTTCSTLGRSLEFDYAVTLGPAEGGHCILDAACTPAPDDSGSRFMCVYLDNAGALMESIAGEKPLVGRPLPDVFAWRREFTPAGCYCTPASRGYKWGLVYEVLHYALTHHHLVTHRDG